MFSLASTDKVPNYATFTLLHPRSLETTQHAGVSSLTLETAHQARPELSIVNASVLMISLVSTA